MVFQARQLFIGPLVFIVSTSAWSQRLPSSPVARAPDHRFEVEPEPKDYGAGLNTTNTSITLHVITGQIKPEAMSFLVSKERSLTGFNAPTHWIPYTNTVKLNLGEGDGDRYISYAARWKSEARTWQASGFSVTVSRTKPEIVITNPPQVVTFQQIIQLKGYSPKPLQRIQYDVFDESGRKIASNERGSIIDQYFDETLFRSTTNYFQCYDVELSPGTNRIALRVTDNAGNCNSTNLVFVFTTKGDTNAPVFQSIGWPKPGANLAGSSFTLRGVVDDYTARMGGQIVAEGRTNAISGEPERNGTFWYENIPLALGRNEITLTATDAAGNTSTTNLVVIGAEGATITMDPITHAEKLWEGAIAITGRVIPANSRVWINGVEAVVKPDGTWRAEKVPTVSPDSGGVAVFDMTAVPGESMGTRPQKPLALLSAQASLGATPITLNPSAPVCGVFQLHLNNLEKQRFILLVSTNLVQWTPILTNFNPEPTFDFADTNANNYPCRYFQVVPLQD